MLSYDKQAQNKQKNKLRFFPKSRDKVVEELFAQNKVDEAMVKNSAILLTFFGCGKWRYGPGTLTSAVAVVIWFYVSSFFLQKHVPTFVEFLIWMAIIVFLFIYGLMYIPFYSHKFEKKDHPSIVIDEVVGQWVTLCLTYPFFKEYYSDSSEFLRQLTIATHISSCFIFFRFFDIAKPSIIGRIDRHMKDSFGIMFDDLVCGLISAFIIIALLLIFKTAILNLHQVLLH